VISGESYVTSYLSLIQPFCQLPFTSCTPGVLLLSKNKNITLLFDVQSTGENLPLHHLSKWPEARVFYINVKNVCRLWFLFERSFIFVLSRLCGSAGGTSV
jgi:hypothetical protein